MGRLMSLSLAVAALAGCVAKEEGRTCAEDPDCPSGQKCGYDLRCSKAAAACPGTICREDDCAGNAPRRCVVSGNGVCASLVPLAACSSGTCDKQGGVADCLTLSLGPRTQKPLYGDATIDLGAELVWTTERFLPPATLDLRDDAAGTVGALAWDSVDAAGRRAMYTVSYIPPSNVDQNVVLTARLTASGNATATTTLAVDTIKPKATVGLSCSPCTRDGTVTATVTVTDTHPPADIQVSLDDGGAPTRIVLTGTPPTVTGSAAVDLGPRPFPSNTLTRNLAASATPTDAAQNRGTLANSPAVTVGRLRWDLVVDADGVTSPALLLSGGLAVGTHGTSEQLRRVSPTGSSGWRATLQAGPAPRAVLRAPASSSGLVWAASEDGRLYAVTDSASPAVRGCPGNPADLSSPVLGPTIVAAGVGLAGAASASPRLLWEDATQCSTPAPSTTNPVTAAAVSRGPWVYVVTSAATGPATVQRFTWNPTLPGLENQVQQAVADGTRECSRVSSAPALDSKGNLVVGCENGEIFRIDGDFPSAATPIVHDGTVVGVTSVTSAMVIAGNGDLLVGANNGIHRLGVIPWHVLATETITGIALGRNTVYATTASGSLHALQADNGGTAWSGSLGSRALDFPNVLPGTATSLPTLYVGSADGRLRAVVVDEELDSAAPWPKAHHDVANTGNPGTPIGGQ